MNADVQEWGPCYNKRGRVIYKDFSLEALCESVNWLIENGATRIYMIDVERYSEPGQTFKVGKNLTGHRLEGTATVVSDEPLTEEQALAVYSEWREPSSSSESSTQANVQDQVPVTG